jgi:hypothetical protein
MPQPKGNTFPGLGFPRQLRYRSRLLFHWRAADYLTFDPTLGLLRPITGEVPSFSRASAGGHTVDANGRLRPWAQGQPRVEMVDLDGDGLRETPGLLLEGQRTNLLLRSEEFDNASWTKANSTVTANADRAPDGNTTADRLVEDTTGSVPHSVSQAVTATADATYALSVFAKAGTRTWIALEIADSATGANRVRCNYDLSTGALGTARSAGTGSGAVGRIEALADGWYRCILTGKVGSAVTAITPKVYLATGDGDAAMTYTGDGSSYVRLWGAQFEDNVPGYASSYIQSQATTVTRSADLLTYPVGWASGITPDRDDFTAYVRFARPARMDLATAPGGTVNGLMHVSYGAQPDWRIWIGAASNVVVSGLRDGTNDRQVNQAFPSGAVVEVCAQLQDFAVGGKTRLDVGAGFSAYSPLINPLTGFGAQTLAVGGTDGGPRAFAGLQSVKIAQGLYSLDDMRRLF